MYFIFKRKNKINSKGTHTIRYTTPIKHNLYNFYKVYTYIKTFLCLNPSSQDTGENGFYVFFLHLIEIINIG